MNKRNPFRFLCLIITLHSTVLFGEVRLPTIIGDGMVIQRDTRLKVWGWADTAEKVIVTFNGKSHTTTTGPDGQWIVWLPSGKAGGPYTMEIKGDENEITLTEILVGDVYLCAGQSNMVHYLDLHKDRYASEIAAANYPQIRQFLVPMNPVLTGPAEVIPDGKWKAATPEHILRFSVVAYFFAKELYDTYGIPIGLINASVGGSPIEAWTSEEGLKEFPDLLNIVQRNKDTAYVNRVNRKAAAANPSHNKEKDKGLTETIPWYEPAYVPRNWKDINIPGYWEDQGIKDLDGVVWYRRELEVPESMTGVPAKILLGRIVDADFLYINGELVGQTGYQYPQRRYTAPAGLLKPGKNTVVIRVINKNGKGGFVPDKPYYLVAAGDTLDLKGYWQYKVGEVYSNDGVSPGGISLRHQPAVFYNGMIAPFTSFAMSGILWYQGESNTDNPEAYGALLPALISDWRTKWQQDDLPFLYVQLPNFMAVNYTPSESDWARLRQTQLEALQIPHTAMAVAIDLGEWNDIHPGNKKPIGDRLALAARKLVYNEKDVVYSGPLLTSSVVRENKVVLSFNHTGSGLISRDGEELRWFAVAGEDKRFVWAHTVVEDNKVIVWNDAISYPVYVRYAWANNPNPVNFYNKEGLPASPFEVQVVDLTKLWHGKKAAVVLTYDDALEVHLDNAIPVLDSLGFKATFYLTAAAPGSKNRIDDWKRVAKNGHELGNHTLFHPCDGTSPSRTWVTPENDLSQYTTAEMVREIEMTNIFLEALDGKNERTFAYTCGEVHTGEGSFIDAIKDKFISMRGVSAQLNRIESLDLTNLNCYVVDEGNAHHLRDWAEKAKAENALLVVLFHGVGGGHSGNIDLKRHHAFLKYLKNNQDDFWVTTMLDASKHCVQQMKK